MTGKFREPREPRVPRTSLLVAEAGIRFMALKNVSWTWAFRYRYATPNYSFNGRRSEPVASLTHQRQHD